MTYHKYPVLIFVFLMMLQSCKSNDVKANKTVNCLDPSSTILDSKNIDEVSFSSSIQKFSISLGNNKSKGYRFTGQKGQVINYQIKPTTACVWLYASDNQVLTNTTLPKNDLYILQVTNPAELNDFQLSISMDNKNVDHQKSKAQSTNAVSLGWLRIGAVNSTEPKVAVRDKLIKTTQEVTIDPPEVPEINSEVTIVNSVNLRDSIPKPPTYKLTQQRGIIPPGQKVIIMETNRVIA
jgi:hypothetical protein